MIRFFKRVFILSLILLILLAATLYFIDKEFLIVKILSSLPENTPIGLGQVSFMIEGSQDNRIYGLQLVDHSTLPIQRIIKAEYADVIYDSKKGVVNIVLNNGRVEEKNIKEDIEPSSINFDNIVITLDPAELKQRFKKVKSLNKLKNNQEF
jgi:hypothetical protein